MAFSLPLVIPWITRNCLQAREDGSTAGALACDASHGCLGEKQHSVPFEREGNRQGESERHGSQGAASARHLFKASMLTTQLKDVSANKSTNALSLHISWGSDQSAIPGLQLSSRSKARAAQPAFPSSVLLRYQQCITAFSPATSYRAGGLLMLCMSKGWQQRKLLRKRKRLNSRETATFLSKRTGG